MTHSQLPPFFANIESFTHLATSLRLTPLANPSISACFVNSISDSLNLPSGFASIDISSFSSLYGNFSCYSGSVWVDFSIILGSLESSRSVDCVWVLEGMLTIVEGIFLIVSSYSRFVLGILSRLEIVYSTELFSSVNIPRLENSLPVVLSLGINFLFFYIFLYSLNFF